MGEVEDVWGGGVEEVTVDC